MRIIKMTQAQNNTHSTATLTHTCCPISQHAFGTGAAAIGAKAVEALHSWKAGFLFTLVDIFQARYTCQKHTQETDSVNINQNFH